MGKVLAEIQALELKLASKGPNGGDIIGKTKSGKDIYKNHDHPAHNMFTRADHKDAADEHHKLEDSAGSSSERLNHRQQFKKHRDSGV